MKKFLNFKVLEWAIVAVSLLVLSTAYVMGIEAIPRFDAYVNDYARVLPENFRHSLNERLHNFELTSPGHPQVVIAIVQGTGDMSIEEFANKAFHNNKLGHADNNNGVLTVISLDRKMRIEVGYDLEPSLTDSKVHDIMDSMKPALKTGNFQAALDTEMSALLPLVSSGSAENVPAPKKPNDNYQKSSTKGYSIMSVIVFFLICLAGSLFFLYRRSQKNSSVNTNNNNDRRSTPYYGSSQSSTYKGGPFATPYEPSVPISPVQPRNEEGSTWKSAAAGALAGFAASELMNSHRKNDRSSSSSEDSGGDSSSRSSDYSSSSDSSFSGGSGDSGGGGGSDSW